VLALSIFAWRKHLTPLARWLDIGAPGLILAQAIGRWGNFINQELYGPPTSLPWGIRIDAQYRIPPFTDLTRFPLETTRFHPVFLYESLWNLGVFVVLMIVGRRFEDRLKDGDIFAFYLIGYGLGRILVESLRPDAWLVSGIPTAQIISAGLILLGVALIVWHRRGDHEKIGDGVASQ
jgi:phosphatidylglycerol:prolipoprotein diacylglycerol transferase